MSVRTGLIGAVLSFGLVCTAQAAPYLTRGQCDGLPKLDLQTTPGHCVGLLAHGLHFPRGIVLHDHVLYVAEMGAWAHNRGRLLAIGHDGRDEPVVLLSGLDRPNGLVVGPDGLLYLGLADRVLAVRLGADGHAAATPVLLGLPGTGRHPLVALAPDGKGKLYLNVGSATNNCEPHAKGACPELNAAVPRASILWFRPDPGGPPQQASQARVVARGLRNAMALTVLPSGALVAAVNARDAIDDADESLSDDDLPHDTYVVVKPGADYGWPYCYDRGAVSPEYRGHDCARATRPALLLAPHAAPLGMVALNGSQIVLAYHGYRALGHRVMQVAIDANGSPHGEVTPLIWGWHDMSERSGPHGAPTALAVAPDGSVLVSEDHNGTVLRWSVAH